MHIPDIIAHRGSSRECLENTLAAFTRALEQQADGIELDVHGTADGHVVVHHDPVLTLERGGDAGGAAAIRELTLPELRRAQLRGGHPVPLLDDVLALVGTKATVYIEVKAPRIEAAVAALLDRHPTVRTAVHSFDHRIPAAVRMIRPTTEIGFLSDSYLIDPAGMLRPTAPGALWQYTHLIDEALVISAHERGTKVIAWTENDPVRAHLLASWGVDGLCTDVPATIRAAFYP
ncbi:glycerophosphodiester phosphodiesterase [Gemmatimonas groenlandica]|uniref:Glycerophosphodiester phosphodiesterase n=1 Tax=Gemmatimonas groenlandica TaxID=2732249 RepID=A0A6M4IIT7_9BACT|nr:glycerophosphodiester phosphodiesterase [Gemmatimonas groenlandica]QJR35014.1 glycerophosphodiester phosphodiesterase [Gemmatimonas groenlandica]